MADEGTDVSNVEQLSFCTRSVDDDLNVSEDFMGFYELKNIKSEKIVNAIKDILLRSHLSLENCHGHTYDGASNMMGKQSGVSTQISAEQPKAMTTHCQGHPLSLAIKSLTKDCTILRNTLGTVGEICVLVKYSPKREKMLGSIMENIESEFEEQPKTDHPSKLDKLCVTIWTVRIKCFKKILDNYEPLLQLWKESLKEDLDFKTKSRIIGCKKQIKLFTFYFGLNLSKSLYLITDNLSKTLQKEKISAIGGKELVGLTVKTLKNMRNDRDFKLFCEKIETSASKIDEVSTPMLPIKRKKPNYSILQYVEGNPKPTGEAYHPENVYDHFKQIYFEALDAIVNAINDRFDQPAFELFSQVEQLLLKSVKKQDVTDKLKMVEKHFKNDYDEESLIAELQLLPTIFEEESSNKPGRCC